MTHQRIWVLLSHAFYQKRRFLDNVNRCKTLLFLFRVINLQTSRPHSDLHRYANKPLKMREIITKTMCFIVQPLSFVKISIGINQSTFPMSHVIQPFTMIKSPIFPYLFTSTMSLACFPLTQIYSVIRKYFVRPELY